jgi:prevent-host-death family protein
VFERERSRGSYPAPSRKERILASEPLSPAKVENFRLHDQSGRSHELYRQTDVRALVLFVTGNCCPIARHSVPALKKVREQFSGQEVLFWMLTANPQDDRASIRNEADQFQISTGNQRWRRSHCRTAMKNTVSISQLQDAAPALVRQSRSGPVSITRHGKTVAFLVSREHVESLLETVEVLATPEAMKGIRAAEAGRGGKGKTLGQLERELGRETGRKAA